MLGFDLHEEPFNHGTVKNRDNFESKLFLQSPVTELMPIKAERIPSTSENSSHSEISEKESPTILKSFHTVLHSPGRKYCSL